METAKHDLVVISPTYRMGLVEAVDVTAPAGFSIHYIRLNSSEAVDLHLAGTPLPGLPPDSVVLSGQVLAPEGLPLEPDALGSPVIGSMDEALSVVARALANPRSVLCQKGFAWATPVYIWHRGRKATKAIHPSEE